MSKRPTLRPLDTPSAAILEEARARVIAKLKQRYLLESDLLPTPTDEEATGLANEVLDALFVVLDHARQHGQIRQPVVEALNAAIGSLDGLLAASLLDGQAVAFGFGPVERLRARRMRRALVKSKARVESFGSSLSSTGRRSRVAWRREFAGICEWEGLDDDDAAVVAGLGYERLRIEEAPTTASSDPDLERHGDDSFGYFRGVDRRKRAKDSWRKALKEYLHGSASEDS